MKRLNALFLILISVTLFSCREEQYIDEMIYNIKNNTDSTLHVSTQSYIYRETTIHPSHTAFVYSDYCIGDPYFWFDQGLAGCKSVTVRLNDVNGDTLAHWVRDENNESGVKWFYDYKYWEVKRIDNLSTSTEFTLPLNKEDFGW